MNSMNVESNTFETKLTDKLKEAETRLQAAGYNVTRLVKMVPIKANECYSLQVFGQDFYDLEKVRSVLGKEYKYTLNTNLRAILIK